MGINPDIHTISKSLRVRVPSNIYDKFLEESAKRSEDLSSTIRRHLYNSLNQDLHEKRLEKIETCLQKMASENSTFISKISEVNEGISNLNVKQNDLENNIRSDKEKVVMNLTKVFESLNSYREIIKEFVENR